MRYKTKKWYNIKTGCVVISDKKPGKEWERFGNKSLVFWSPSEQRYKAVHRLGRDIYNFLQLLQQNDVPCSHDDVVKLLKYHRALKNITWFPKQIRLLHSSPATITKFFEDKLDMELTLNNHKRVKKIIKSISAVEEVLEIKILPNLPPNMLHKIFSILNS